MNESHMERDDRDLENLLLPSGESTPSDLRLRWRETTSRGIRRRGRWRRAAWGLSVAASFLVGLLATAWVRRDVVVPPEPSENLVHTVVPENPKPMVPQKAPFENVSPVDAAARAVELEWRAFDSNDGRAVLYFQAGGMYRRAGDLAGALRCYRQALDASSPEELVIRPDDDWLVANLKEARRKGDE